MQIKKRSVERREDAKATEQQVFGKQQVERKEPGRSAGGPARLVWHLTSSSLYTELITVMQGTVLFQQGERH